MESLFGLFFCAVVPVVALISLLVFLGRRTSGPRTVNPYVTPKQPAAPSSPVTSYADLTLDQFAAFDRLLSHWARQGSLSTATVSEVRARLAEHVATIFGAASGAAVASPMGLAVPAMPQPRPVPAPAQTPLVVQPAAMAPAARPSLAGPAVPVQPSQPAAPSAPPAPPKPHRPSPIAALGAAVLALDTRRVLLYLGSFLLVMSALTLVIFNWSSFSPLVQFALLAGTTGGIWAGGTWMTRKPDLKTAGVNLQFVAALLMPVVGFALGRPGLLNLEPRSAWLLASGLSLGAYLFAAWRTGRGVYSGAAALAAVSALLAALGELDLAWQPVPVLLLLALFLPIARGLRAGSAPHLAAGPRWVALVCGPTAGLAALAFGFAGMAGSYASAASLAAAALFCALAAWTERRRPWLWAAVLLVPPAVHLALAGAEVSLELRAFALGFVALGYVALAELCAVRLRPATWPLFSIGLALAGLVLPFALSTPEATRVALLPPILLCALLFTLVVRGRLAWVKTLRVSFSALGLALGPLLLATWLDALIALALPDASLRGLLLLPLAAPLFAGARWWPGRQERAYDVVLQLAASLLLLFAGGVALFDTATNLTAALLLALILGGQATLRRAWPWATLSIGAALVAVAITLDRSGALWSDLPLVTLVALGCTALLSLIGERLRHTALRYWSWPALGWGAVAGIGTFGLAAAQLFPVHPVAASSLVGLAALLGAHCALWRRAEPGYGAAPLLALGVMLAATEGFYTGWQPARGDLAYVLCALVLGLALLGRFVGRFGKPYERPYELLALVLLPTAPLLAGVDPAHLTLTWAAMAVLYSLALWSYRVPAMLAPAFLSLDMALLQGAGWLWPGGDPAAAGVLLAGAVVAQSLASAWIRRRPAPWAAAGQWGYLSALVGGCGALLLAAGSAGYSALVALVLAALLATLVWIERREPLAWASLALLGLGLWRLQAALGVPFDLALLFCSFYAVAIYALGWGVQALGDRLPRFAPWRRPLAYGVGGATLLLPAVLTGHALAAAPELLGSALLLLGLGIGVLGWRERQSLLIGPALIVWTIVPVADGWFAYLAGWERLGSYVLLILAMLQGVAALWAGRRRGLSLAYPVYAASLFAGALAFAFAAFSSGEPLHELTVVAGSLALLWGVVASVERSEPVSWGSLGLLSFALFLANQWLGLAPHWAAAWLVLELVGVCLAGWVAVRAGLSIWRRSTTLGVLVAALAGAPLLLEIAPQLTFALASLGLLLATLAVRERQLWYAYAAGASFVGAALCQLADWGFSEPQWYVMPAGLYLLALAAGLRRFQGQRRASQVVESVALLLLLGVTFGQAVRLDGGLAYSLLLFGEALLIAGYGALLRLRVPFLGGVAFFVAGVVWMSIDTVRLTNQWVLLGAVGLLMVAAYVILERHQERLLRAGRFWAAQLRSWG